MNVESSCANCLGGRFSKRSIAFFLLLVTALAVGCGGNSGTGSTSGSTSVSTFSGNTSVVLLASSTANDELSAFSLSLTALTLVDQSGKSESLLSAPVSDDFIHVNGNIEPLVTVSIPQGIYTSAQVTVDSAVPACEAENSGTLYVNGALGSIRTGTALKVNLPQPITVTGTAMGLVLNLQGSSSTPFSGGCPTTFPNFQTLTPAFNLTPITISAQPTSSANGRMPGLLGIVSAVSAGGSGFTAQSYDSENAVWPVSWQISLNSSTAFQGISDASRLSVGMPVDMDVNIQADGSLLATRVAVPDTNTSSLEVVYGPVLRVLPAGIYPPYIDSFVLGKAAYPGTTGSGFFGIGNSTFQVSGQFKNLQNLPFTPVFGAANMVDGQNVFISVHGSSPFPTPAATVELLPQTINGTVTAVSSAGNFTTYTVSLAPYSLFPNLAVQPGQTSLLASPNTVVVYTDSTTQRLNSNSIGVGGVFRFYGLIFNDNGTLRMDCAQVSDGVAE
jgi:hypothetical protein